MKFFGTSLFLVLAIFAAASEGYRILCLFPFNGRSHFIMFEALCKGLARRGHQVDMISHFPTKTPLDNYTDVVDLNGTRKNIVNSFSIEFGKALQKSVTYSVANEFGYDICKLMGHERMQKFIKNPPNDPPYDLLITEYFGSNCYLGFGPFLNTPIALAISSMEMSYVDEFMGNPLSYAYYSGKVNDNAVVNTFWDRLFNLLINFSSTCEFVYYTSGHTDIMRKYLGQDLPDGRELERRVSLVLTNSHFSFYGIRPVTPAIVEVGGIHIEEDQTELSPELKSWLDSANDGVVYFTLGSLMNIETLPESTMLDLYASFAQIAPVKVLMKCADHTKLPPGLPSNVLTLPWMPQIPVLRHKNTRIFITHGGLMGSQEAIYYGIPMIGIPIFADQIKNVNIFVEKNMAVLMDLDNITKTSMDSALNTLLNDPKYKESAKRASQLFRDRPMSPLDTAVYWVEYVIKNGRDSLRSPAMDLPWWKLHLIDVFAFLLGCLLITICTIIALVKFLFRRFTKVKVTHKKKRN